MGQFLTFVLLGETNEDTEVWTWGENNLLLGHPEGDKDENTFPRKVEALVDESVVQVKRREKREGVKDLLLLFFFWFPFFLPSFFSFRFP